MYLKDAPRWAADPGGSRLFLWLQGAEAIEIIHKLRRHLGLQLERPSYDQERRVTDSAKISAPARVVPGFNAGSRVWARVLG
jgi:hypothetical protein